MESSFGARVRAARIERGLRQAQLASALGCSPSHISNVENGYILASAEEAARIAQFLKMPPLRTPSSEPRLKADHAAR